MQYFQENKGYKTLFYLIAPFHQIILFLLLTTIQYFFTHPVFLCGCSLTPGFLFPSIFILSSFFRWYRPEQLILFNLSYYKILIQKLSSYNVLMNSIFRLYAKTSIKSDQYLYNQLLSMGIRPKYEELLHSFYFDASFNQIFKLSFSCFTLESFYIQLGHKYPLSVGHGENQQSVKQFFQKINFRNYIPIQRQTIANTTLNMVIRQSSAFLPSDNVIISLFRNHLEKETIIKQYRKMVKSNDNIHTNMLENYYDIKQIVEKKWLFEDQRKSNNSQKQNLLTNTEKNVQLLDYKQLPNQLVQSSTLVSAVSLPQSQISFCPHFILYIRRNHARMLLKINKQSMHKYGWKKHIGWGPIRQSLVASILYRTGMLNQFRQKNEVTIWDPFCGSGTIPLVSLSMLKSLQIRKKESNFTWEKWPIYKQAYLEQYFKNSQTEAQERRINIFGSDIDIGAVRNSINNFEQFMRLNKKELEKSQNTHNLKDFLDIKFSDHIYEVMKKNIYIGCGDFDEMAKKIFPLGSETKVTIITNLPYVGERSKQHHQMNQLRSIYKRFSQMVDKYSSQIQNVFIIIDSNFKHKQNFMQVSSLQWRVLDNFDNGGIEVSLLGWSRNTIKSYQVQSYDLSNSITSYSAEKNQNLQQYREEMKKIQEKKYTLPKYMKKENLKGSKRVLEKKKARHLEAAYQLFAKRRDKQNIYARYARKNLALRLSKRGQKWSQKNMAILEGKLLQKEQMIKKQFESRIEEALKRSQELKQRKKKVEKAKKKW